MPTYDYQCRDCGNVTEVIHSMLEDGPTVCERCGGALRRVIFPSGIIFKGSGFYRTDSRSGAATSSTAPSDASGSSAAETSGSSAGDGVSEGTKAKGKEPKGSTTPAGSGSNPT